MEPYIYLSHQTVGSTARQYPLTFQLRESLIEIATAKVFLKGFIWRPEMGGSVKVFCSAVFAGKSQTIL